MYIFLVLFIPFILNFENIYVSAGSDYGYQDTRSCKQGLAKLNKENEDLRRRLESLESKFDNFESDTNKKEEKFTKEIQEQLKRAGYKLDDRKLVTRRAGEETPTLAFSTKLRDHMGDIGMGQTIVFKNVDTNIGGKYNDVTGVFTCDKPGLYYFSINAMVFAGKYVQLGLTINGSEKFRALADARGLSDYDTGSNFGVFKLQSGDSVWVKVGYHLTGDSGTIIYRSYTSFTGFLISTEV